MDDDDDDSRGGVGDDSNDAFAFAQWNLYAQFFLARSAIKNLIFCIELRPLTEI